MKWKNSSTKTLKKSKGANVSSFGESSSAAFCSSSSNSNESEENKINNLNEAAESSSSSINTDNSSSNDADLIQLHDDEVKSNENEPITKGDILSEDKTPETNNMGSEMTKTVEKDNNSNNQPSSGLIEENDEVLIIILLLYWVNEQKKVIKNEGQLR